MEPTKDNIDSMYMNIDNFSKAISGVWNINSDVLRDYIFSNISIGLIRSKEARKDVDKLYIDDKLNYYNAALNSTCINHVIMKQGTLEQEVYARKVLGILLVAEDDYDLRSKVVKILRKYYPIVYNAVKKHSKKELKAKYLQMDEVTREMEAKLDAAVYFYFAIYRSSETVDQGFIVSIINDMRNFEFSSPMRADIDKELENHRDEIQEIKALIKREYGRVQSYKDILNSDKEYIEELGIMLENLFIINKLDISYIFHNSEFLNIDRIILSYIKAGKKQLESRNIVQVLISGVFIQSLLNEYKNSRDIYFRGSQETLFFQLNDLEEKLQSLQRENEDIKLKFESLNQEKLFFDSTLEGQINKLNKSHKAEISDLEGRIKDLEEQLAEEKKYRSELNTLREYIFEVSNGYVPNKSDESLNDYIRDKKILIIGGAKEWRRRFRDKYPEVRALNGFNDNFEPSILGNADYIFFYTGFMNHSTYYKAMNFIRSNQIKFGYIGKTNIDLVEEEIIEAMKRDEPS